MHYGAASGNYDEAMDVARDLARTYREQDTGDFPTWHGEVAPADWDEICEAYGGAPTEEDRARILAYFKEAYEMRVIARD